MKKLRWSISSAIALIALSASLGFTPLFVAGAPTPKLPTMTVVAAVPSVPVGGGTDFTVYVQTPDNPPDLDGGLRDLLPSFIVESIANSLTPPNRAVIDQGTLVTCTTGATNKFPGYPSRGAETTCSGVYPQRADPRSYSGSNTAIYFLGLAGLSPAGTWTVTFVVSGLYFGSTITLTSSAKLNVASTTSGSAAKSNHLPTLSVVPGLSSIAAGQADDFYLYVQVPNNPPISGTFFDLQPAFVVQSITESDAINGTSNSPPTTFITCSTTKSGPYPGYPSRNAETTCSGLIYYQRVIPRAYWGSNTGIWFLGFIFFSPETFTATFTVTGLFFGNTITLTATSTITVT